MNHIIFQAPIAPRPRSREFGIPDALCCGAFRLIVLAVAALCSTAPIPASADDVAAEEQAAVVAAVGRVAPSVVQVETIGGREQVEGMLVGAGPTTGLIVDPAGYIISSAFNFIGKPASILVRLPDGSRKAAQLVATDHARMLVLLKIDADRLPVCQIAPRNQMRVGQWAIAVGRTFSGDRTNLAVGILSALDRIWGRAIQTDAAVSPNNYGGPLVDIHGRVMGVLAPLSPQATNEIAGSELYDSGIGFAVPAEDIVRVLPRLKKGEDLYPGVAGASLKGANEFTASPFVAACRAKSPADVAGIKAGDLIVAIGGRPVRRNVEVRNELGRHYAGDKLSVTFLRGKKRIESELVLTAKLPPFERGFLGILPLRGGDEKRVVVRYVYPKSPAAEAGIAAGDAIVSLNEEPVEGRADLMQKLGLSERGTEVSLEVRHGDNTRSVKLTLGAIPEALPPDELPPAREEPKKPTDAKKKDELPRVGAMPIKLPEYGNKVWAYVPSTYNPQTPYGLVIWLHAPGGYEWEELLARWRPLCDAYDLILVAPKSSDSARWAPGEAALVDRLILEVATKYHLDPTRIVVHGYQGGGAMAFLSAFRNRLAIRAVASVEAAPVGSVPEGDPLLRFSVYLASASKSSAARPIDRAVAAMRRMKIPVTTKDLGETSRYLKTDELSQLARWIDMLDRI